MKNETLKTIFIIVGVLVVLYLLEISRGGIQPLGEKPGLGDLSQ
jgi:hypothetical protein